MKIQCDVCEKDEAAVYCIADEAALCSACDHRVHHANKLAEKHQRFTLQNPPPKQAPLCDICHEKRAFLFCQQDRAILCRDCDVPIHKANELTQKHNRFLLTGVKLSPTSTLYSNESSPSSSENIPNLKSKKESKSKPLAAVCTPPTEKSTSRQSTTLVQGVPGDKSMINGGDFSSGLISQSSISEYLIETLPGWHVEDFLDCSFPSPHGLFQSGANDLEPFWDEDLEKNIRFGVPQVNRNHSHHHDYDRYSTQNQSMEVWGFGGNKEQSKDYFANNMMINKSSNRKWIEETDGSFLVPQMSHTSNVSKRSRTSCLGDFFPGDDERFRPSLSYNS